MHAFAFIKAEYHLELIIHCIWLYVGRGNGCSSLKMPKNRLFLILGYPTHFGCHGLKENEIF